MLHRGGDRGRHDVRLGESGDQMGLRHHDRGGGGRVRININIILILGLLFDFYRNLLNNSF